MRLNRLAISAMALLVSAAQAAQLPVSQLDPRIGTLTYQEGDLYRVATRRGYVTRIQLGRGERIEAPPRVGDKDGWIVDAQLGASDVYIKPKSNAFPTNLELVTDCCSYSFDLVVLPDGPPGARAGHMYRISFEYPVKPSAAPAPAPVAAGEVKANLPAIDEQELLEQRMSAAAAPINWRYSMQVQRGAQDIVPSEAWDDGRFTYFRVAGNRELPQVFRISADGEENRVNKHIDGDLIVVHEVAQRWVLRLGKQIVGIWNEAYDVNGVAPRNGTSLEGVGRVLKAVSLKRPTDATAPRDGQAGEAP